MVDFQGFPVAYLPADPSVDKRRTDAETGATSLQTSPQQIPLDSLQLLNRDAAKEVFLSTQVPVTSTAYTTALHSTVEPVRLPDSTPMLQSKFGAMLQNLPGQLERIISQMGSYFFARRKNVTDVEELEKRRLNDFFSLKFLEEPKVEATYHSASGENAD
jgi:hypothetical protein